MTRAELKNRLDTLAKNREAGELPGWLYKTLCRGARAAYRLEQTQRRSARCRPPSKPAGSLPGVRLSPALDGASCRLFQATQGSVVV